MMNPFALSNHVYKEMDDKRKCFRWIWSDETVWFQLHNEFIHGGESRRKHQNITIVVSDWYTQTVLMILPALPHPGWFCTWPSSHPFTACITFLPHRQAPCDPTTSPLTDSHLCFCAACCPQDCVAPFLLDFRSLFRWHLITEASWSFPTSVLPLLCFTFLYNTSTRHITYSLLTDRPPTRM